MVINVLEKLMPAAAKLGTKAVLELIGAASIGAGVVSFGLDKGVDFINEKLESKLEDKKQDLMKKRAAVLEQKAEEAKKKIETEKVQEVTGTVVEAKPKASNKKNK